MSTISGRLNALKAEIPPHVTLVAVSKTHAVDRIQEAYDAGQRDFGENRVQELESKVHALPEDIRWHLIGHLQRNKVKFIAPYVHMIHSVDSWALLQEIDKQAAKCNRNIACLLQVHIAEEETKFGLSEEELFGVLNKLKSSPLHHITLCGLMGMATLSDNSAQVRN
ncbi:MAG: YggS family pyridoxal phosphate-dependent enzyme, partial [Flavobacteriales bacterium]|nr:YggS family pyridoxal phosphate-dependent enzyme [Flavobacteriales bacterium]